MKRRGREEGKKGTDDGWTSVSTCRVRLLACVCPIKRWSDESRSHRAYIQFNRVNERKHFWIWLPSHTNARRHSYHRDRHGRWIAIRLTSLATDHFLVISDELEGPSPWKYVNVEELQEFLCRKIDDGFCFPLNPKWILADK